MASGRVIKFEAVLIEECDDFFRSEAGQFRHEEKGDRANLSK